jgi:hypothetical protein
MILVHVGICKTGGSGKWGQAGRIGIPDTNNNWKCGGVITILALFIRRKYDYGTRRYANEIKQFREFILNLAEMSISSLQKQAIVKRNWESTIGKKPCQE